MVDTHRFEEEIKVTGQQLVEEVKRLIHEGNVRHIIIKSEKGDKLLEIPVTFATVGALILPVLAAVGALAALVTNCTIVVVKEKEG
jgi:CBS domain-containing protein